MKIFLIITALILSGCSSTSNIVREAEVVVKVEYITKLPPKELLEIPPLVELPDEDKNGFLMQSDIAKWVLLTEKRMRELENKIIGIGKFYYQKENE